MYVARAGERGPAVLLIHGSGPPGTGAWTAQMPLADRFRLIAPHRKGYPPNPPLEVIDFDRQADEIAELLAPGTRTHVVGHSYGAVIGLVMAGRVGERVASLTVIEPPAFGLARGNPDVEATIEALISARRDTTDVRAAMVRFLQAVGSGWVPPDPLTPEVEAVGRAGLAERGPWEAEFAFDAIRAAGIPALVVSGAHSAAFDAVCDVLERELGAERVVFAGRGHGVQRVGDAFNQRLAAFIAAAD
jgi:pimeloyl-ACP methyl ester carboxylesterase